MLYIIVIGVIPWEGKTVEEQAKNSIKGRYELPVDLSEDFKNLIEIMLNVDPDQRASTDQILDHPWLSGCAEVESLTKDLENLVAQLDSNKQIPQREITAST